MLFEHAADAEELMRELWRVAAPNARLIVVVPRRRGMWAAADNHAASATAIRSAGRSWSGCCATIRFVPEHWREGAPSAALNHRLFIKFARFFERFGRLFGPLLRA